MFDMIKPTRASLASQVADQIAKMAIQDLDAGQKLPNEFELAESLGVGRGTIREAVKILISRNILEVRRGKGTFVCEQPGIVDDPFSFAYRDDKMQLARDLLEARFVIEPWVAEMAALRATPDDIRDLFALLEKVETPMLENRDYASEDIELHTGIAHATHNQVVPNLIPIINSSINLFLNFNVYPMRQETLDTHRQVVESIAHHDPQNAKKAMIQHLNDNVVRLDAINELLKKQGQPSE